MLDRAVRDGVREHEVLADPQESHEVAGVTLESALPARQGARHASSSQGNGALDREDAAGERHASHGNLLT
jgi:hypothetical protein